MDRRKFVSALGLGLGAAALAGCGQNESESKPAAEDDDRKPVAQPKCVI